MSLTVPGVDFAWGKIPYDEVAKQARFVMRYISHDAGKDLSVAEKNAWFARGVGVGLVFETTANRALQGRAAGVEDARWAAARANSLGLDGIPIFFAVDFDVFGHGLLPILGYFAGVAAVLGLNRTGVYGGFAVCDFLWKKGAVKHLWQTYAWSGGHIHPNAAVYQHQNGVNIGGLSCDLDRAQPGTPAVRFPQGPQPKATDPRKRRLWRQHLVSAQAHARALALRIARLQHLIHR